MSYAIKIGLHNENRLERGGEHSIWYPEARKQPSFDERGVPIDPDYHNPAFKKVGVIPQHRVSLYGGSGASAGLNATQAGVFKPGNQNRSPKRKCWLYKPDDCRKFFEFESLNKAITQLPDGSKNKSAAYDQVIKNGEHTFRSGVRIFVNIPKDLMAEFNVWRDNL